MHPVAWAIFVLLFVAGFLHKKHCLIVDAMRDRADELDRDNFTLKMKLASQEQKIKELQVKNANLKSRKDPPQNY